MDSVMQRRDFLEFLAAAGAATLLPAPAEAARKAFVPGAGKLPGFTPVAVPAPMAPTFGELTRFEVKDALVVPREYRYEVVVAWGDRVFADPADHFGYNNDFTAFLPLGADDSEGLLWVNHEYVSEKPWLDTYNSVIGKPLPGEAVLRTQAGSLDDEQKRALAKAVLYEQGGSIVHLRRDPSGRYQVVKGSKYNRRVSGIEGLDKPERLLDADGPAATVLAAGKDGLGKRIVGTFANCSGGVTPWGTVLSCEENFQSQVPDAVDSRGVPVPAKVGFDPASFGDFAGAALGLAPNKYGWVVEIDPRRPEAVPVKRTALGRFRHENVAVRAVEGKPLACYMGDDRTGGHTWKFVSRNPYRAAAGAAGSALLAEGTLYIARYRPDGTGEWVPLVLATPVDPADPTHVAGGRVLLPNRPAGGPVAVDTPEQAAAFKERYKTLADLYESEGAMLIDAFLAANAVGGTPTARPEDLEIHPTDGSVFIAYTSGAASPEGGPDDRIFVTAFKSEDKRDKPPHGAIYRLFEEANDPAALRFRWKTFANSGEIAAGGAGFAFPDNLCFDSQANLWICSDIGNQNQPVPNRTNARASATSGLFGSNTLWFMATDGAKAGTALPFATGPVECELTGPTFTNDGRTLFLAVQHPGEGGGWRKNGATRPETEYELLSADGKRTFVQTRSIPAGSNFPSTDGGPPKPCVVAIRRR
ncbi:PhoX family protein [Gloeobacter violaceus]|uniref:Gll0561 protein n=1 Tax=Gloeobacter violaceus (strain ATCC 29082 / PCC 7421) TaxID=251221 RepID=Q7NN53_GLOVI|nr:PhoX family protein [Gloeobacter violaceus]BAC88502.1 gll0561 [Gloeobacter violaceus PCC 7421]